MTDPDAPKPMGFTEVLARLEFGQTIGETMFLDELLTHWSRRLDLSKSENQEFLERFVVGQLKATFYLAQQIDELKEELQKLRLELANRP